MPMSRKYVNKNWHDSDYKHRLAVRGEDITAEYLKKNGARVIDRNVRFRFGELDIVAISEDRLCFVEVKTRSSTIHGRPSLALTPEKQYRIRRLAEMYMRIHKEYRNLSPRIDVSEILIIDGKVFINYIKGAF